MFLFLLTEVDLKATWQSYETVIYTEPFTYHSKPTPKCLVCSAFFLNIFFKHVLEYEVPFVPKICSNALVLCSPII